MPSDCCGSARKPARNVHFPACNIQENSHFSSSGINFSYTEQAITNGLEFDYISMPRPAEHKLSEGINTKQDTLTLSHSNQNATLSQAERYQDKNQDILINLRGPGLSLQNLSQQQKKIPGKTSILLKSTRIPPVRAAELEKTTTKKCDPVTVITE